MKKKEKKKVKGKILFIIIPLLLIIGTFVFSYSYVNNKIYVPNANNFFGSKEEQDAANYDEEQGIINIMLIGLDGRNNDQDARTDSIILATLDTNNKRVKLTSFMRDMYVPIPGHKGNRINAAYFFGGPELLMKTMNEDFGLNIQYYVSIDFKAFQQLVDKMGGIDIEVKDYEVKEINKYIKEVNGANSTLLEGAGYQHLNGQQALSYSRIRHVGNNDFERTERQRRVLGVLINKARKVSVLKLPDLFNSVLPYIKTNIPATKLMNIGYTIYKFGSINVDNLRIPADGMFEGMNVAGASVLVPDLQRNADELNRFIFSDGGSIASSMPVYMVNNYHMGDKAVDKRGQKKPIPTIEIPKPDPKDLLPEDGVYGENPNDGSGTVDYSNDGQNTGNTGQQGSGNNSGTTNNGGSGQNSGTDNSGQNGAGQSGTVNTSGNSSNTGGDTSQNGNTTGGDSGTNNGTGNSTGTNDGSTGGNSSSGTTIPGN